MVSEALLRGAELLGFGARPGRSGPHPDQVALGELLDEHPELTAVSWPRRGGKTEAIWMWLVGMCDLQEDFNVVVTAQTGSKSRERFLSAARKLDRHYPEDAGGPHIRKGAIVDMEFGNGSRLWSISPDPDNFRGDAIDVVFIDEAQSFDPEKSESLRQAVPPVLDTVEHGQIILAGTPGLVRAGWYWQALESGRVGTAGVGLSEFRLEDHEDVDDEANWHRVHPGLKHGLTTIEKMRVRHHGPGATNIAWRMEYCGQWPPDAGVHALDLEAFRAGAREPAKRPARLGVAFDVAIDGSSATLAYAWRDARGVVYAEVVEHELGTRWLPRAAHRAAEKLGRGTVVAHDRIGSNADPANALEMMKPKVKQDWLGTTDVLGAAQRIAAVIADGRLRHFDQPDLVAAVENAAWRDVGRQGRAFTQKDTTGAAVNPLIAVSLALWEYDKGKERKPIQLVAS